MGIALIIVTVVSLLLATGMSVVGWTLLRSDRRRSAARVEALGALADATDLPDALEIHRPEPAAPRALPAPARFVALDETRGEPELNAPADDWSEAWDVAPEPWDIARDADPAPRPEQARRPAARAAVSVRRAPAPSPAEDVVTGDIFGAAVVERRAPLRRWLALGAVTVVMVAGAGIVYFAYRPALLSAASGTDAGASAALANARPLELLSLTHATDADGGFSLTGLVQNPAGGAPIRGVVVVVYLFDRGGNYFATGKAPLDLTSLQPGNESPFIVRVPNASHVGRFRVGFRMEDGRVVSHVDKRGQPLDGTMEVEDPTRPVGARAKGTPGA